jgi:predicted cupin superfamily sugar epimerase
LDIPDRDVHRGAAAAVYFLLPSRRGSSSFHKIENLKIREFTQNFHFKKRYTVKLDEFHRLEAIALV